jgi:hypothetical protein
LFFRVTVTIAGGRAGPTEQRDSAPGILLFFRVTVTIAGGRAGPTTGTQNKIKKASDRKI